MKNPSNLFLLKARAVTVRLRSLLIKLSELTRIQSRLLINPVIPRGLSGPRKRRLTVFVCYVYASLFVGVSHGSPRPLSFARPAQQSKLPYALSEYAYFCAEHPKQVFQPARTSVWISCEDIELHSQLIRKHPEQAALLLKGEPK